MSPVNNNTHFLFFSSISTFPVHIFFFFFSSTHLLSGRYLLFLFLFFSLLPLTPPRLFRSTPPSVPIQPRGDGPWSWRETGEGGWATHEVGVSPCLAPTRPPVTAPPASCAKGTWHTCGPVANTPPPPPSLPSYLP